MWSADTQDQSVSNIHLAKWLTATLIHLGPGKARTVLPTPGHLPADVTLGTILGDLLALIVVDGPLLARSTTRLHQVLGGACGLQ